MSEEKMTLNGVNVGGCRWYVRDEYGLWCDLKYTLFFYRAHCSENPECYYKQLQREKQKNEFLINEIETQNDLDDKLIKENNVLRKTLKEIEEIAEDRSLYCENCNNDTITCENCGYIKILEKMKEVKND